MHNDTHSMVVHQSNEIMDESFKSNVGNRAEIQQLLVSTGLFCLHTCDPAPPCSQASPQRATPSHQLACPSSAGLVSHHPLRLLHPRKGGALPESYGPHLEPGSCKPVK